MNTRDGTEPTLDIDLDETAGVILPAQAPADPSIIDEDGDVAGGLPAHAIRNGNGTVTLPLRFAVPLSIRSATGDTRTERYERLTFHRLTGADIRAVNAASKETQPVVMMARSARVKVPVMSVLFDKMDGADIADGMVIVDSFFGNGRTTGRST